VVGVRSVVAEVDLNPRDSSGEGGGLAGIQVVGHRRAGIAADVGGFVRREDNRDGRITRPSPTFVPST
jgi:hypothetical protein